jgi:hypothetical protein
MALNPKDSTLEWFGMDLAHYTYCILNIKQARRLSDYGFEALQSSSILGLNDLRCFQAISPSMRLKKQTISSFRTLISTSESNEAQRVCCSLTNPSSLPGADSLATRTGATVIANCEATNALAKAGVPEEQLFRVAGGKRVPLFTKETREQAKARECLLAPAPPGAPPLPHPALAIAAAHVWPSLHCLMSHPHPDVLDTGEEFTSVAHDYVCTMDITRGMKYGLLQTEKNVPRSDMDEGMASFVDYVADRDRHVFSHCDGGQLMVNFVIDGKGLLWNAHLGAYEGIMKSVEPRPEIAILGIAGRANFNGRPWKGSAAQFALNEVRWLEQPKSVIWCLHDERYSPNHYKNMS